MIEAPTTTRTRTALESAHALRGRALADLLVAVFGRGGTRRRT
ncbi:MAG: hypothetical protein ACE368_04325 [Paracoccaceae bacterium]